MKTFLTLVLYLLLIQLPAQTKISNTSWQEDLKFLQETVHKDYPFLFKKITAKDFDVAVERFHKEIPQLEDHEVVIGFSKIVGLFQYGHTQLVYEIAL